MAEMISASTARTSPTVIEAPTIFLSWPIPGRPLEFGSISMSSGSRSTAVRKSIGGAPDVGRADVLEVCADVQQPVRPSERGACQGGSADRDEAAGLRLLGGVPAARVRCDGPGSGRD